MRKAKIEANRRRSKTSLGIGIDSDSNSLEADETQDNHKDFSQDSGLEDTTSQLNIESDFLIEALENNNISVDDINDQIMEIENTIMGDDNTDTDVAQNIYHQTVGFELSDIPIDRPIAANPNEFNLKEMEILRELMNATRLCKNPEQKNIIKVIENMAELKEYLTYVYDQEIKNFVKLSKSLHSFNSLCETDRLCLVRNHCFPALLMRAVLSYNFDTKYWILFLVS